ncbi:MAG: sulfurtransferase [Micromonosporaceae bacterium]
MSSDPFLDAPALDSLLRSPARPTVLDARWRLGGPSCRTEHAAGHIPGAMFVDVDTDICGPPGARGRHPLPDPAHLQAVLRRLGVVAPGLVVVYDGGDGLGAARTWWTLRWAGLPDVRVLEGGFPAWVEHGFEVSRDIAVPTPSDLVVRPGQMPAVDASGAAELARAGRLIDVRAAERYRGEQEPIDTVAGHIPGAVNRPAQEAGADGQMLPREQLRRDHALDAAPEEPVGVSCGSGITAARTVLAMTAAGQSPALYVGSWSDWITDPDRPVSTGPNP